MKRYTNMEIVAAIIGLAFVVSGLIMLVHPEETTMTPEGPGRYAVLGPDKPVHYSKTDSQIVGGLSVVMGAGTSWLALFVGRKR